MKRVIILLALCLVFQIPGIAEAIDGYAWNSLNSSQKIGFVMGWILGARWGVSMFSQEAALDKELREKLPNGIQIFIRIKFKLEKAKVEFNGVNLSQIVEVVDWIYSDPRVKQWNIEEIMPVARGRLKQGWTEKDIDEVIAYQLRYKDLIQRMLRTANQREKNKLVDEMDTLRKPRVFLLEGE